MTSLFCLQALLKFKYEELYKLKKDFFIEWNKNNKCECCSNLDNINQYNYLICEHSSKEASKKFAKKEKSIKDLNRIIKKMEILRDYPQFFNPLTNRGYFK
ncbi:MAG: hypothetical protein V1815_00240 [Candidatus Woesearchaeota archaeon]